MNRTPVSELSPRQLSEPHLASPGSAEKVELMRLRYESGLPIFVDGDATDFTDAGQPVRSRAPRALRCFTRHSVQLPKAGPSE